MKNSFLKIGLAHPKMKVGNPSFIEKEIEGVIFSHPEDSILLFPELSLTGYTCGDLFQQEEIQQEALNSLIALKGVTKKNPGQLVVVGLPLREGNALYNVAALLEGGKALGFVPKTALPNYSEFYERRWFASGEGIENRTVFFGGEEVPVGTDLLFESNEMVIGVEICEDLFIPDKPSTHLCLSGANLILNLSASDELIGKREYRRDLVRMQSAESYCDYLYCSAGTGESSTDLVYSGASLAAENGRVLVDSLYPKANQVDEAILDVEKAIYNRVHQNTFRKKQEKEYRHVPFELNRLGKESEVTVSFLSSELQKNHYEVDPLPFVPKGEELSARAETILAIQAHGLATRMEKTGLKNMVIGVSGGLDSTLALIVCHEARKLVPGSEIIAYTMPNHLSTSSLTKNNATSLMKELRCEIHEVEISKTVAMHLKDIGHSESYQGEGDVAYENAQARMRTYILMDVANMRKGLVIGTGDLSELALGWCTYNGDHMSMYGVNASIPKTLIKYLVQEYAKNCEEGLRNTLLSVLDTPITPELTPSRGDQIVQRSEDVVGKYDLNDFFLFYFLRFGFSPEKILALASLAYPSLPFEQLKEAEIRFYKRFYASAFKRSCLPDGPKVGTLSLSPRGDYRMPSDADCASLIQRIQEAE